MSDTEEKTRFLPKPEETGVARKEEEKEDEMFWKKVHPYQVYALVIFLVAYLLNQLDRYMLAITIKPMAQEVKFGDEGCMRNTSYTEAQLDYTKCNATNSDACVNTVVVVNGSEKLEHVCDWDYNGEGFEYQIVAGPVFILIYTFAGIFISFAADKWNRKAMLAGCLIWWSVMTTLTGFVQEYWQLVVLRFGVGLGEAGCTPFVVSMLADIYPPELRGTVLGIYNWGIYMGYSMSYALGNLITVANINGQGWRWAFFISGIPGVLVGILTLLTLSEPDRKRSKASIPIMADVGTVQEQEGILPRLKRILKPFLVPSLILAILAGAVRNAAGYVFAYNTQPYFTAIGESKEDIAKYMSWIPLVGGSLGVMVGGFISDRVVKQRGIYARIFVVIASLLVAAPFAAGTLFFNPPMAYVCQIPTYLFAILDEKSDYLSFRPGTYGELSPYVPKGYDRAVRCLFTPPHFPAWDCALIGEMWIGIILAVVVEVMPVSVRTSAVAVYLFIISNIGGNAPLLVPPIQHSFEYSGLTKSQSLRGALYILYPSLYVIAAIVFIPAMFLLKRDQKLMKFREYVELED